ncbi:hypothetical protein P154DRAFT_501089 [Amniculicola lignicola CBS 123094]|uniref:Uncharacterized protein n=1 Tax=Amniculicola lignicola CBS 123094 TaxID=1392246 RepID=A0A6A5VZI5_9PLEO|nr:hypothetical protein P154DRAFT_501089 [Amniculicola lignicola CBS 123094]
MVTRPGPGQVTHPGDVARQAVLFGGAAAIPGFVIGAFAGTLRTSTPVLFATASSLQWFALGSTFWAWRACLLNRDGVRNRWRHTRGAPLLPRNDLSPTEQDRVIASTVSGSVSGALAGAMRGARNVAPGALMFAIFGFAGQHAYNWQEAREAKAAQEPPKEKKTFMQRLADSNWFPMRALSDEEYETMLNERLLQVEAEIALVDERIVQLKKEQQEQKVAGVEKESENSKST